MSDTYRPGPVVRPPPVVRPGEERRRSRSRSPKQWWDEAPIAEEQPAAAPQMPTQQAPSEPAAGGENWWASAPLADAAPAQEPTAYEQYVKPVVGAISGAVNSVGTAIQGKQDPQFADIKNVDIRDATGLIMDGAADSTAVSDAAYADVYAKALGDKYIGTIKDKNGYPIIRFKGDDGSEKKAYVNRPGLDWHDFERAVSTALPYMVAASGAGAALKGAGLITNMAGQAGAAGLTSISQDVGAQSIGSQQPIDRTRATVAMAAGAGGEIVGRAVGPLIRRWMGDRSLVTADGKLTPRGIELAKREGIDPDLVNKDLALEFKRLAENASDPAEALVKAQTDRFGIPTTKGQRTNDPQMLLIEKDIRAGTLGDRPKEMMRNLDDSQKKAIEGAALGGSDVADTFRNAIAPRLAPARGVPEQRLDFLGDGAKSGLVAAKERIKDLENKAWAGTENIAPRAGALKDLPEFVQKALGSRRVDDKLTPSAHGMAKELDAYMKGRGEINPEAPEILGQQSIRYIDEMRRRLMAMKDGAAPGADAAASKAIYKAYDDWMVNAAEKNLLTGKPGAAQALLNARRTTAELRNILKPLKDGRKTAATRILEKVDNADTGEEVIKALLGASGPKSAVPDGGVKALLHYKAATTQLGGDAGKAAWNDVRLAYWLKLVAGKNGDMLPNGTLITSIKDTFATRPSLMNALYTKQEQTMMKQFAQAIRSATPKDPNPPGSGTAVRGLFPNLVKDQLQVAASRNRLASTATGSAHKRFMAGIYRALSRIVPNVLDGKNVLGSAAANRVTSQALTPKRPPSLAGYATAFSPAATSESRVPQFSPPPNALLPRR